MGQLFATWWAAVTGYFAAAASVFTGHLEPVPLLALLGLVCLASGLTLLIAWRVRRVTGLWWLAVAAVLAPVAVALANSILGWVGMLGAVLAGGIILVVGTAVVGNSAERRLPVWLVGLFLIDFSYFCALAGGAFVALNA